MEEEINQNTIMNNPGRMNSDLVQIRLDCKDLHREVEEFLNGTATAETVDENGQYLATSVVVSDPLANPKGVGRIMNIIRMRINPQVVQGNFSEDMFCNYVADFREELMKQTIFNCYNWNVIDDEVDYMIDNIVGMVQPFMSRLIDNKERESYSTISSSREVVDNRGNNGLLSSLGSFGRNRGQV